MYIKEAIDAGAAARHPGKELSDAPPKLEQASKRVSSMWVFFTAGFGLIAAGFTVSTVVLGWKVDALNAGISNLRQDIASMRIDLKAEAESRNTDRQRIAALEAVVGTVSFDTLAKMRASNRDPIK
jgi:hypothetical protein